MDHCVCVSSPVRARYDLLTVDDHELLQHLSGEFLAALGAVGVAAHAADTHVLCGDTQTPLEASWN